MPEQFWGSTLRELQLQFEAQAWNREINHFEAVSLVWLSEGLARQKRLPPLKSILTADSKRQKPTTKEEIEEKQKEFEEMQDRMKLRLEAQRKRKNAR